MNVPTKEVGHPAIFLLDAIDLKLMPCRPRDIELARIAGSFGDSSQDDVAYKFVLRARMHGEWVGVEQGDFLTTEHMDDDKVKRFKAAYHSMVETGLIEIPGLKSGFMSIFNIFRTHIACPTKILVSQVYRHELHGHQA